MVLITNKSILSKGFKWKGSATVVTALLQLLQLFLLAHWLPSSVFGVYAIIRTLIGFGGYFSDAGMYNALLYGKPMRTTLFTTLYLISIVVGLILFAVLVWLAPLIAQFYMMPSLREAVTFVGLALFISALGGHFKALLQRDFKYEILAFIEVVSQVMSVIITLTIAYYRPTIMALVYGYLVRIIIATIGYVIQASKTHKLGNSLSTQGLKYYLNYAAFQLPERWLGYLSSNLDVLLLGKLVGQDVLGAYELFKQFLRRAVHIVNPTLDHVLVPIMTAAHRKKQPIGPHYLLMVKWSALLLFPVYISLFFLSDIFVLRFFGEEWVPYSSVFMWLCIYYIFHSVVQHIGALWVGIGKPQLGFYWNLGLLPIMTGVVYISSLYGIEVLAEALTILMLLQGVVLYYVIIKPKLSLLLENYLGVLWKPIAYSLLSFFPLYVMKWYIHSYERMIWFVLVFGIVIYSWILYKTEGVELRNSSQIFSE